jgi:hypothetical protein
MVVFMVGVAVMLSLRRAGATGADMESGSGADEPGAPASLPGG